MSTAAYEFLYTTAPQAVPVYVPDYIPPPPAAPDQAQDEDGNPLPHLEHPQDRPDAPMPWEDPRPRDRVLSRDHALSGMGRAWLKH